MIEPMPRADPIVTITTTRQRPDLIDTVAAWVWSAFRRESGHDLASLRARTAACQAETGPEQCFVLLADGEPAGTVGLIHHDLDERPELTPWLAAMYVRPEARGRGYARQLIRALEHECMKAGIDRVWLYTHKAERLYASLGWRSVETIAKNGANPVLMCRDLSPGPAEGS